MASVYYVRAVWDDEASLWVSESNIPGLVIEADRLGEFEELTEQLAPDLLAENVSAQPGGVAYVFTAERRRELQVA